MFIFMYLFLPLALRGALAHEEDIGPLRVVEKVYGAPAPIGRIVVRYDATNDARPKLHLRSDLFRADVPSKLLLDLPRPNWDNLMVPYSLLSFEPKTRNFIKRPYLYIAVPLYGPPGKSWQSTSVHFSFNNKGQVTKRILKQFVPMKKDRPRPDLPQAQADYIAVLYGEWPLNSRESAETVLARALKKLGTH